MWGRGRDFSGVGVKLPSNQSLPMWHLQCHDIIVLCLGHICGQNFPLPAGWHWAEYKKWGFSSPNWSLVSQASRLSVRLPRARKGNNTEMSVCPSFLLPSLLFWYHNVFYTTHTVNSGTIFHPIQSLHLSCQKASEPRKIQILMMFVLVM